MENADTRHFQSPRALETGAISVPFQPIVRSILNAQKLFEMETPDSGEKGEPAKMENGDTHEIQETETTRNRVLDFGIGTARRQGGTGTTSSELRGTVPDNSILKLSPLYTTAPFPNSKGWNTYSTIRYNSARLNAV